ncbi:MAG: Rne/Rng family ribonuclease [Myxococcota bacterium]
METELLVSRALGETRVAVLEDGVTQEVYLEREHERSVVGNIYRGRVTRVLPGMQAAFVDIGLPRAAFLYVDDIVTRAEEDEREEGEDLDSDEDVQAPPRPSIHELIQEGQEITVQVTKAPLGSKGARVTTYVTVPGRSVVFMPTMDRLGVSRKILDEDERKRLKEVMEAQRGDQAGGFIARTACVGLGPEEIGRDMAFVRSVWADVDRRSRETQAPALLQADLDLVLRSARDLFTDDVRALRVDREDEHERVVSLLSRFAPHLRERVIMHEGPGPLFETQGVERAIEQALARSVPLASGGSLVVDEAEALTAIDVNTGSFVGSRDLEATILRTNLEAATAVALQIRLRNLGGIIIVDFIDMTVPENRTQVHEAFVTALGRDRARTHVLPMTDFGLVELTRKRVRPSLGRTLTEACPYCDGRGWVRSRRSVCQSILRSLASRAGTDLGRGLLVSAMPEVAIELTGPFRKQLENLERELAVPVVVEARAELHQESFEITVRR